MVKFDVKRIGPIVGKEAFYQLVIDDVKILYDFFENLEEKYQSDGRILLSLMNQISDGASLPHNKFKDITKDKSICKEYEFKKNDLRVYAIKTKLGKMIILCGYKNNQQQDIVKFRSLIKQIKHLI